MTAFFKRVPYEVPRALRLDEIAAVVKDFRRAAENAMEAGFAGRSEQEDSEGEERTKGERLERETGQFGQQPDHDVRLEPAAARTIQLVFILRLEPGEFDLLQAAKTVLEQANLVAVCLPRDVSVALEPSLQIAKDGEVSTADDDRCADGDGRIVQEQAKGH